MGCQILPVINAYLHAKNHNGLFTSLQNFDWMILQYDWLGAFWAITWEFCQALGLDRKPVHHRCFYSGGFLVNANDKINVNHQRPQFWITLAHFPHNWQNKSFHKKIWFLHILLVMSPQLYIKNQKNEGLTSNFQEKMVTDRQKRLMLWQKNNGETMWPHAKHLSKKSNRNQKVLNSTKMKSPCPTSLYACRYCTTSRYLVWRVFVFLILPPASSASSGFLLKQMSAGEVKFTISLNNKENI